MENYTTKTRWKMNRLKTHVYVVVDISTNDVIMVYKNHEDIDDEYYKPIYSIQHVFFWK